ncbi:MAG: hypothetical protein ACLGGX_10050 [Bdellovibrionia bacterium]
MDEGHSLLRIKNNYQQVSELLGTRKAKETAFIRDYLATVEANRLLRKAN